MVSFFQADKFVLYKCLYCSEKLGVLQLFSEMRVYIRWRLHNANYCFVLQPLTEPIRRMKFAERDEFVEFLSLYTSYWPISQLGHVICCEIYVYYITSSTITAFQQLLPVISCLNLFCCSFFCFVSFKDSIYHYTPVNHVSVAVFKHPWRAVLVRKVTRAMLHTCRIILRLMQKRSFTSQVKCLGLWGDALFMS